MRMGINPFTGQARSPAPREMLAALGMQLPIAKVGGSRRSLAAWPCHQRRRVGRVLTTSKSRPRMV